MNESDRVNIENRLTKVEDGVVAILTNHLPHIKTDLESINRKFWIIIAMFILLAIDHLQQMIDFFKMLLK